MFAPRTPEYYSSYRPSPAGPAPWPDDPSKHNRIPPHSEQEDVTEEAAAAVAVAAPPQRNNSNYSQQNKSDFNKTISLLQASSDAQMEADRRRGLEETYTTPITTTSVKNLTKVTDFMSDFNKFSETYESTFLNHLQEYKTDLQPIYKKLVPSEITHKAFVQHYFFRCGDLQRIQDDLDEAEKARIKAAKIKRQQEEEERLRKKEEEKRKVEQELAKQTQNAFSLAHNNNSSTIRWKGISNDDPGKRAAWESGEGARISLRATNPPKHVQRQVTMEYNSDAAKAAEQAAEELRAEGGVDTSWRSANSNNTEGTKETTSSTPLYSRLRFPFRRNQHAQSAVKPVLKYTHTAEGEELIGATSNKKSEKEKLPPKMSRSMSPTRPTWEDSASSLNADMSLTKPERQISNLSDHSMEEEPKGLFASIRSQWEQTNAKKVTSAEPASLGKPSSSKLEDSTTDFQHAEHMRLPAAAAQEQQNTDASTKPSSRESRNDPAVVSSSQKRPEKDSTAAPQRSNSARDLIQKMEAVTQERRDRRLGPPVTTTTRGRMPRRNSESSNASAPVTTTNQGRGSMRNFRQSSFAYRGRGTSQERSSSNLQTTSTHSQPARAQSASNAGTTKSDSSYVGSVRSRAEAWRQRGSSVSGSRRNLMSARGRQASQSSFASESLQGDPVGKQPQRSTLKHQRSSSTSSSTSSLNMSEPSLGVDPNSVPTTKPIPRNITTNNSFRLSNHGGSNHSSSLKMSNHGSSNHSSLGFIIPTDDSLALKSVVRANRRRNLTETYTEPLESLIHEDPNVEEYIENFDLLEWKDEAILALAKYQDTLAIQHETFVLSGEISERDFWCRYFYKCNERRILEDMRRKQSLGILGQSSRNVFSSSGASMGSAAGGKTFARGPHLQQQKAVSGPAGFGSSFRRNEMRNSNHSGLTGDGSVASDFKAPPPRAGSLKEKLQNWNKVTTAPGGSSVVRSRPVPSAAERAQRYRNRSSGSRGSVPASHRTN